MSTAGIIQKIKAVSPGPTLLFSFYSPAQEKPEAIEWMIFEQAVQLTKKNPRPIVIDVYTTWCGPCKMMSKNIFGNQQIAN